MATLFIYLEVFFMLLPVQYSVRHKGTSQKGAFDFYDCYLVLSDGGLYNVRADASVYDGGDVLDVNIVLRQGKLQLYVPRAQSAG